MTPRRLVAFATFLLVHGAAAAQGVPTVPPPMQAFATVSNATVVEGNEGMTKFTVHVTLAAGVPSADVTIEAGGQTAGLSDFYFEPRTLHLVEGPGQDVEGYVLGDRSYEGDEIFLLQMAAQTVVSAFYPYASGTITIADDDADVAPHFGVAALTVPEGDEGVRTVELLVKVTPAPTDPVSVDYALTGGVPYSAARAPWGDYVPVSGNLSFQSGEASKTISFRVMGDTAWEPDTRLTFALTNPMGALIDTPETAVVIANDDPPAIGIIDDVEIAEGQTGETIATMRLHFDRPPPPQSRVRVDVIGGSARLGEDFVGQSIELFPAPATSLSFGVSILGDTRPECDEGLVIQYQGVGTGADTMAEAKLLVRDDDPGDKPSDCPDPFTTRSAPSDGGVGADGADGGMEDLPPPTSSGGCAVASPVGVPAWPALVALAGGLAARRRRRR